MGLGAPASHLLVVTGEVGTEDQPAAVGLRGKG